MRPAYSDKIKARAVELYESGLTGPAIMRILKLGSKVHVYEWVRKAGKPVRQGGIRKRISKQDSTRNSWLRVHYGITNDDYNQMFVEQEGKCKLCGRHQAEFKYRLGVDHNHQTNEVRGLLCRRCNVMVSVAEDFSIPGHKIDACLNR